jgi:transcriptional regulatory protein RtcR
MATLAPGGRITRENVEEEIERLRAAWHTGDESNEASYSCDADALTRLLGKERAAALDLFDRQQLAGVLRVCHESQTLSEAGRKLFTASRGRRKTTNDADRLRKFLARFDLDWKIVRASAD